MTNKFSNCPKVVGLLICFLLISLSSDTFAQDDYFGSAGGIKEYFTEQPASTILVIRLDAFESEFESRIYDPKKIQIKASGLPSLRLGALYQLIEYIDTARQLRIEVTPGRSTDRSKLDMQVIRFQQSGPDKTIQIQAYRLLSSGLELEASSRREAWTMKVINLTHAASTFDELGMQEMKLWSQFYAYHLLLLKLNDPLTAAEGAREINIAARRSRLNELVLASLQLEGSAIAAQLRASATPTANAVFDQAQSLFQQAAELAAQLDLQHQHAVAIYHSGFTFEDVGQTACPFVMELFQP